jgi:FkbM family methyltransferase
MCWLRGIAERISRRVVLKRRLPAKVGGNVVFVTPDASLRFWRRNLTAADPALFDIAAELVRPGEVVWDIGANVGLFTFAAAALAGATGRVLAVEPDTWLVELLRRSARLNLGTRARVDVLPAAVADVVGIGQLHIARRGRSSNYLSGAGLSQAGGSRGVQQVVTVTLDWLLEHYGAPTLVKIDVEGAEDRVLRGAARLLSTVQPVILCEVAQENAVVVSSILKSCRYTLLNADLQPRQRQPLESAVWNTLAWPPAAQPSAPSKPTP